MAAPERSNPAAPGGFGVSSPQRLLSGELRGGDRALARLRSWVAGWSGCAWGAIGVASTFFAITCWWLSQDRSVPIFDAGGQLETALQYRNMLAAGDIFGPFTYNNVYPIFGHTVGALGALVGGVNVASPIVAENLVFVPLLALGCYQTGRLLYGSQAGLLAVMFVFGSPLLSSLFHVFMLDAPLTALVAVSVWLILASEDFSRPGVSALAGLAVGLGLNIKIQFGLFLVGLTLIVLLHGGWRNWRGLALFAAVALLVGTPWYVAHSSELERMFDLASSGPGTPAGNIPPTFSIVNFTWYFWSILNSQLLAPLFILALGGTVWMLVTVWRSRGRPGVRLEFLAGSAAAWLAITLTPHHDIRYGLPMLAFLAVLATGWITRLPRPAHLAALALLAGGVLANQLGTTFGLGGEVKLALAHPLPSTEAFPDRIVLYTTDGFLASAPGRDGDVPGLLHSLREQGVSTVAVSASQAQLPDFSLEGLYPLARIAKLSLAITAAPEFSDSLSVATIVHAPVRAQSPPTCTRLSDGTGIWVLRYDPSSGKSALYCPSRHPHYYHLGAAARRALSGA